MTNKNEFKIGIVLTSLVFFAMLLTANASATLAFDNDCPVSSAANINFSNGTSVFLPFSYNSTNTTNSNLTVFLGTNTNYFCSSINDTLSNFTSSRKVIFTPEFLNALKTSSCNSTFERYMENYRKSGDILGSSGTVFCGIRNITFDNTTGPSGITFNYPIRGSGNMSVGDTPYNGIDLKKYMIAYLMNNDNAELSGIVLAIANAVGVNLSAACPDADTVPKFFNSGKGNYTTKFKPGLLGINWTAGEELKPSGGRFGWLTIADYALGSQVLPVITAANLSTNRIYACGLIELVSVYENDSVAVTANTPLIINGTNNTGAILEIITNANVTAPMSLAKWPENPHPAALKPAQEIKYLGFNLGAIETVLSSAIIKVYYTDAEVSGLDESTLRLYYYNETSGSWQVYDSPNGGVNTTGNYVWANTTHFSDWGIFGSIPTAGGSSTSGCDMQGCTAWSSCSDKIQTRTCASNRGCGTILETRKCEIIPVLASKVSAEPEKAIETPSPVKTEAPETKETPAVPLSVTLIGIIAILIIAALIEWKILNKTHHVFLIKKRKKRK